MELKNHMEALVLDFIPRFLDQQKGSCSCTRCQHDIAAIALNLLPSQYVVTDDFDLQFEISKLKRQYEADIMTAVVHAYEKVSINPNHETRILNPRKKGLSED